jgi:cold shock protein
MLGWRTRQSDRVKILWSVLWLLVPLNGSIQQKDTAFIQPQSGGKDVFVHISAVERAGLNTLNEGATVDYEIVSDRGKESAGNLKVRK